MPTVQQYRYDQDAEQAVCDKPPDVTRTTKFQLMMFNGEAEQQNCGTPTECHSHGTTTTQAAALRRGTSARISHYSSSWGDDDDTDDSAWLDTVGTKIRRADAAEGGGWGDDIVDWDITNKTAADESHNSSDHGDDSVQYYTCSGSGSKRVHSSSNPAPDDDEPPNKKHKRSQDELLEARKCDEDQCEDVIRIHPHYPQHNPPNTQNVVEHTATKRFHMCECDDDAAPLRKKSKTSPTPDATEGRRFARMFIDNEFVGASSNAKYTYTNADHVCVNVAEAGEEDVEAALRAARASHFRHLNCHIHH
eukprot:TRINITY_DN68082_c1_g1_i1.p2 TRINITY_DN68082_c1_g1~~TRINITY_DN68082_c1_g1_i1.p2  ORF type:complete len:306 (-),score=64.64 TRINITY_DN68082_c1_g1_i1:1306-2223(-)